MIYIFFKMVLDIKTYVAIGKASIDEKITWFTVSQ